MKNLLLIFLLLPNFIAAQVVAFDIQYKTEHGEYAAKLSTFNQIITMVDGMTCDDFTLTTDNGTITKTKKCTWNYTPTNYKKGYGWIYFNKIEDGKTVVFHKKRLKILLMDFQIMFPPFQPDEFGMYHLTTKKFMKSRLYMMSRHKFYEKPIMISSLEVKIIRDDYVIIHKRINQPQQDIFMDRIDELYNLQEGDEVLFENIKYQYPSVNDTFFEFEADDVRVIIE